MEDRRMLAAITVNSSADDLVVDEMVTLREAIQAANTDASVDGSIAGSGADTIEFDGALSGQTITLGGTDLEITEALTIDATALASNVTVDANQLSRIFNISANSGDFALAGLTLTGGRTTGNNVNSPDTTFSGAAVRSFSNGSLTIDQSTVSNNSTTGKYASGGGIRSRGAITITSSTVSGNSTAGQSARGGGMHSSGSVTLTNSTVSGNSTAGNYASGGGIYSFGASTLTNSTVSGNSTTGNYANGGGMITFGDTTLASSTVSGNHADDSNATGGGIWNNNDVINITNSIVAGNTAVGGSPDIVPGSGPSASFSVNFSLIGTGVVPDAGTSGNNVVTNNPMLGALTDNGGPTQTRELLSGSPAIDAGDPSVVFNSAEYDQRGAPFARVFDDLDAVGSGIDMGAFELQPPFPAQGLVVDTVSDLFDGDFTIGNLALREAIYWANLDPTANIVTFDATVFATPQTILLSSGEFEISEAVTIDGPGQQFLTIDAQQQSRIFHITATSGDFTLAGLTLTGGRTIGDNVFPETTYTGGAIRSLTSGRLTIDQSTVSGNSTTGSGSHGGGVFSLGTISLTSSNVSGNSTTGNSAFGGGIFADGSVWLSDSMVNGNSTTGSGSEGGGIRASSPYSFHTVRLINSIVSGNSTEGDFAEGGGISTFQSQVTLFRSTVSGNSTAGSGSFGGGIRTFNGEVRLTDSTLSGNSATGSSADGGGIFATWGAVTLTDSTVSGNESAYRGGGIYATFGAVTLTGSTVSGNNTTGTGANGGGIFTNTGAVTLTGSTVSGNITTGTFADGGGIFTLYGAVTLTSSTVTGNSAAGWGGGVYAYDSSNNPTLTIANSIVAGNTAVGQGPDLKPDSSSFLNVNFSLIGDTTGSGISAGTGSGNILNQAAQLGPLANNGGPTLTHALLVGSPAIDAGDPSIAPNPAEFDQRGAPFVRVYDDPMAAGTGIDMGAYERQTVASLNLVVDTPIDENDGDYSAGNLSLREAVGLANGSVGANTITFDAVAFATPQTILLGLGEIEIAETVTIEGPGGQLLTIDAQQNSRIFNITATSGDFTLAGLTLSGGQTTGGFEHGGAIRSLTSGSLTIDQSTVSGNTTSGIAAFGGGVFSSGIIMLTHSTVHGNSSDSGGGGIFSYGNVTLTNSTVSGNSTTDSGSSGGGIFSQGSGGVTLTNSTLSGNSTVGMDAKGGGIATGGPVTLTNSTVSGNSTAGSDADGGGIYTGGNVTLNHSTVTDNHASHATAVGGGIWDFNDPIVITNSIVAGNTAGGGNPDLRPGTGTLAVNYSLIGTGITPDIGTSGNNIPSDTPNLGPLASNAGPTQTHALLAGSPAIDAGEFGIAGAPDYDQRGHPRVVDGDNDSTATIDIGAFEKDTLLGDMDLDGDVDLDDVSWFVLGLTDSAAYEAATGVAASLHGDTDQDGDQDLDDVSGFVQILTGPGAAAGSQNSQPSEAAAGDEQTADGEVAGKGSSETKPTDSTSAESLGAPHRLENRLGWAAASIGDSHHEDAFGPSVVDAVFADDSTGWLPRQTLADASANGWQTVGLSGHSARVSVSDLPPRTDRAKAPGRGGPRGTIGDDRMAASPLERDVADVLANHHSRPRG